MARKAPAIQDDPVPHRRRAPRTARVAAKPQADMDDAGQGDDNGQDDNGGDEYEDRAPETLTRARAHRERPAPREQTRTPNRDTARSGGRGSAVVAESRTGEPLSRRRTQVGDIYHVPPGEIPHGWDYQWNTFSVLGAEAVDAQLQMSENGFRPVPAERHPGRWTRLNFRGSIVINGLRLEERPSSLGNEARAEDIAKARAQVRDQTDSLQLTQKMPRHFKASGGKVEMKIDRSLEIEPGGYSAPDDSV